MTGFYFGIDLEEIAYSCFLHGQENTPLVEELHRNDITVTKPLLFEMSDYVLNRLQMWERFLKEIENLIEKQKGSEEE